ncbi:MAG: DUF4268 domain-containing protein, partial [Spirochaetota bacterium]
ELGMKLEWQELPQRKASRIITYLKDAPLEDRSRWHEYLEWLRTGLDKFDVTFRDRVRSLDAERFMAT